MTSERRIGATDSKTRAKLLDAAERLLLEEGYAAVTSRRVGREAGISSQLVHYYFRTMDDLFIEVFRRSANEGIDRFERAMEKERSLRSIWEFRHEGASAAYNIEFAALANHRKVIRTEIAQYADRFFRLQLDAINAVLEESGTAKRISANLVLTGMTAVSQLIALEEAMGFTDGHDEVTTFVEQQLAELERPEKATTNSSTDRVVDPQRAVGMHHDLLRVRFGSRA